MSMRRYMGLTNAFSKKVENLAAAVSRHVACSNFCRVHKSLGTTPAVAAGVSDHVWKLDELIDPSRPGRARPDQARPRQEAPGCRKFKLSHYH